MKLKTRLAVSVPEKGKGIYIYIHSIASYTPCVHIHTLQWSEQLQLKQETLGSIPTGGFIDSLPDIHDCVDMSIVL